VTPEQAPDWIETYVVGKIKKEDLDKERNREIDAADMLAYQSIIYHTESILETQFLCLMAVLVVQNLEGRVKGTVTNDHSYVMQAMALRHIFTYLAGIFRRYEIRRAGQPDVHGVMSAKWESHMRTVQVLVDWFQFGYILKHMLELDTADFEAQPYYSYWILVDCVIMFTL